MDRIEDRLNSFNKKFTSILQKKNEEQSCSLRKRRLESEVMQKRLAVVNGTIPTEYTFDIHTLAIPKHFREKTFSSLDELCLFVSELLKETHNDDYNAFAIVLLKNSSSTINDDEIILKYKINTLILSQLVAKLNNIVFTNELIWLLINISFPVNKKICILFATEKYMITYKDILIKYQNDSIIKRNILQLFGNLVSDNHKVQKIFHQSKIVDLIHTNLKLFPKEIKSVEKQLMLWFMACFTHALYSNAYLIDNKSFIIDIQKIFMNDLYNDFYFKNCLLGLQNISAYEYDEIVEAFLINNGAIISYLLSLPIKYYKPVNIIICNLASIDNYIDQRLVQYGFIDFIKKGLQCESITIQSEALWSLSNVIISEEMVELINNKGFIPIIVQFAKSYHELLVTSSLEAITNMLIESSSDFNKTCLQFNFSSLFLEVLTKNFTEKILILAFEAISILLNKCDKEGLDNIFIGDFERKGGKEVLTQFASSDKKSVSEIASSLLEKYYCNNCDINMI